MSSRPSADIDPAQSVRRAAEELPARKKRVAIYGMSLFLDCAGLMLGYALATQLREQEWLGTGGLPIIAVALPLFLMCDIAQETQSVESLASRSLAIQRALTALMVTALLVLALSFFLKEQSLSRLGYVVTFLSAGVFIIIGKLFENFVFKRWMRGSATASLVLVDGLPVAQVDGCDYLDVERLDLWPDLGKPATIDALASIVSPYDRVVVACRFERRAIWATFLKSQDVGGEIVLDRDLLHGAVAVSNFGADDTLILSRGPLSLANRLQKRAFDLVASVTAVLLLMPLLLTAALLIKKEDGGPVFFRQVRVGRANRHFMIYKFRTMSVSQTDDRGSVSASRNDARVTRIGRLLRKTSIDELPQLMNVVLGQMSIVGPRPHALGSLAGTELFWEADGNYWIRHALKPGITGLAQVRGFRGATDTAQALRERVRSDLEYLTNWSLGQDVLIILRTLRVLVHENAF